MKQLDLNGDGTIDIHEFTMWWLGGRPHMSPAMKQVLKAQKKVGETVAAIKKNPVKEITGSADKSSMCFNFNGQVQGEPCTTKSLNVTLLGKDHEAVHAKMCGVHPCIKDIKDQFPIGRFWFEVKGCTGQEAIEKMMGCAKECLPSDRFEMM
jgi:hypothetical protein